MRLLYQAGGLAFLALETSTLNPVKPKSNVKVYPPFIFASLAEYKMKQVTSFKFRFRIRILQ